MIISVVIKNRIKGKEELDYFSPTLIPIGCRVKVMLNQVSLIGFVVKCREDETLPFKLNPILEILDENPVLSPLFLDLFSYLQSITCDTKYDILQQCLPLDKKLNERKFTPSTIKYYRRTDLEIHHPKVVQRLNELQPNQIIPEGVFSKAQLRSYEKKGYITSFEALNVPQIKATLNLPPLNLQQQAIVDAIDIERYDVHVIKGPTGSGKTHVFMSCAHKVLSQQQRVLMCVPEISLTPQMIERFQAYFNCLVIEYHSYLTPKEKMNALALIRSTPVCIVIATRSGLFIDESFGLIIIDEEHDQSFYQSTPMVYHAHDVATFIAEKKNIPLILASATLSLETYAKALKGVYQLHVLTKRFEALMPSLTIVDMREDIKRHQSYMISSPLIQAIIERLHKKEQVLILINRRGAFPTLTCQSCLTSARCPDCGLHLNFHQDTQKMHCHYCSKVYEQYACVQCGHTHFTGSGYGTQSVVSRLKQLFPLASIERLDSDIDSTSESQRLLKNFALGKIDILVGTSLVSKGLDIENVTCVGILEADQALSFLNLRSSESTFAMLMQAAGRSGRASKHGEVIVQVMDPHHRVIECLKEHDYDRFFKEEMKFRHQTQLPPYQYLISIEISHAHANVAYEGALTLASQLKETMHVIGPSQLLKQRGLTRYQLIIKTKDWLKSMQMLKEQRITEHPKWDVKVIANPYALGGL